MKSTILAEILDILDSRMESDHTRCINIRRIVTGELNKTPKTEKITEENLPVIKRRPGRPRKDAYPNL